MYYELCSLSRFGRINPYSRHCSTFNKKHRSTEIDFVESQQSPSLISLSPLITDLFSFLQQTRNQASKTILLSIQLIDDKLARFRVFQTTDSLSLCFLKKTCCLKNLTGSLYKRYDIWISDCAYPGFNNISLHKGLYFTILSRYFSLSIIHDSILKDGSFLFYQRTSSSLLHKSISRDVSPHVSAKHRCTFSACIVLL